MLHLKLFGPLGMRIRVFSLEQVLDIGVLLLLAIPVWVLRQLVRPVAQVLVLALLHGRLPAHLLYLVLYLERLVAQVVRGVLQLH